MVGLRVLPLLAAPAVAVVTPDLNLDTMPVAYFGGNANRRGQANIEMLAKMRMVMIEKWEGHCWQDCLAEGTGSESCQASCDAEHDMVGTLKAVKEVNPKVSGVFYLNTLLAFPFYSLNGKYQDQDALTYDSTTGKPIVIRNDNGMEGIFVFGFDTQKGQQLYVEAIKNLTATGHVDGFFGDKWAQGAEKSEHGQWQICNHECGNVTEEVAAAWNAGKAKVLDEVTAHCGDGPYWANGDAFSLGSEPVSSNMNGWWNSKWKNIEDPRDLITAVDEKLAHHKYVTLGTSDQHWTTDPDSEDALQQSGCDEDCLARFLLAVEEGMMLIANGWDEAYDKPLGRPLGHAVFQDTTEPATLVRVFASGTKVIFTYTDASKGKGTGEVWWGGVAPTTTPVPSILCGSGACASTVLADTTFAKNDVDVATVESAQACCDRCAAKVGCIEWAWHGSKDNSCHMHGEGSQLKAQSGTTAGVMDASCHARLV